MAIEEDIQFVIALVREAGKLLTQPMPNIGPDLIKHLTRVDAYRFIFLTKAAVLQGHYRSNKKTIPGDRARIAAELAEGAADSIKHRVSLGQSILNYLMAEMRAGMQA